MPHGYRTLQGWDKWLAQQHLGNRLLDMEQALIRDMVGQHIGKHAMLIGVPQQELLLKVIDMHHCSLLSPVVTAKNSYDIVEAGFADLPVLTGSVDLVIIPHTINFIEHPRQLLAEACRIVKPEGLLVICTFNPYSSWFLKNLSKTLKKGLPAGCQFISPLLIKNWLKLADFVIENEKSIMYRPPVQNEGIFNKLHFIERIGSVILPGCGGIHLIIARAKVTPLTPIKTSWKQQLSKSHIYHSA